MSNSSFTKQLKVQHLYENHLIMMHLTFMGNGFNVQLFAYFLVYMLPARKV